jgi:hypothetical protein
MADDDLAYGEYIPGSGHSERRDGEGDRGLLGDAFRAFTGRRPQGQGQAQTVSIVQHHSGAAAGRIK